MKLSLKIFSIIIFGFILSACGGPLYVKMKPEFIKNSNKTVMIAHSKYNAPDYYAKGSQGLLDIAISRGANEPLINYLNNIDISNYESVVYDFETSLNAKGYKTVVSDDVLDVSTYEDFEAPSSSDTYAAVDYRKFKKEKGADYLLLIQIMKSGVERPYYGFIPTGKPVAMFNVIPCIIDLETNQIVWHSINHSISGIEGEWDQPPEFSNITEAIRKTQILSRSNIVNAFISELK